MDNEDNAFKSEEVTMKELLKTKEEILSSLRPAGRNAKVGVSRLIDVMLELGRVEKQIDELQDRHSFVTIPEASRETNQE